MTQVKTTTISEAAEKDVAELKQKIADLQQGKIPEEKFKHFRLRRGFYGQRQQGVQMLRTKIPYGKITTEQLLRIADIAETFTNSNLHLTTRQNIQLHHIRINDAPEIYRQLEDVGLTSREACGNTVRNITGSARAGIDPHELFDVSPYVQAAFEYFLRNAICQDMGRKIKVAFSSSDADSAFTYIHDIGYIPRLRKVDGKTVRGFKVVIGGGLGAQPFIAPIVNEFLPDDEAIPFMEAVLRVFDRYGERTRRHKARLKYLVQELGLENFLDLVEKEKRALTNQTYPVSAPIDFSAESAVVHDFPFTVPVDARKYEDWLKTNVFSQKQPGFYGVNLKLELGNIDSETSLKLAAIVKKYAANDIRITISQGLLLKFVRKSALPWLFNELNELKLAEPGFESIADITSCPGTDTCNLAVSNSTGLALKLEQLIREEYYDLIFDSGISIKISGCMNSCGQHMAANIGFHGSSIKVGALVAPAMQIVLGGGVEPSGEGVIADKVIKLPTKKITDAVRLLLDDYAEKGLEGEYFNQYYRRLEKDYFYSLLKPLADTSALAAEDFIDWGADEQFKTEVGVGECAGVSYDVIGSIISESAEKLASAAEALAADRFADSIYHSYNVFITSAKALLLSIDVKCNTQINILKDFDTHFVSTGLFAFDTTFEEAVLQINQQEPSAAFSTAYFTKAEKFFLEVRKHRQAQIIEVTEEKEVINNYYKA